MSLIIATSPGPATNHSFVDNNVPAGTHSYTARAYDNQNAQTTSAVVAVNVFGIALNTPTPAQNFAAPVAITLTASVTASAAIQRVEFMQENTLIGVSTGTQYTFTWGNVPAGTYTFTARAIDTQNATMSSTPVTVTVGTAQQAGAALLYPSGPSEYAAGDHQHRAAGGVALG